MVLGERAEAIAVRQGAERAEIGAEFELARRAGAPGAGSRRTTWQATRTSACAARHRERRALARLHQRPARDARAVARAGRALRGYPRPARAPVARAAGSAARTARLVRRARGRGRKGGGALPRLARAPRRRASMPRQTRRPMRRSASELEWQVRELESLNLSGGRMAGADRPALPARARREPDRGGAVRQRGPVGGQSMPPSRR